MKKYLIILLFIPVLVFSQSPSISPSFFSADDEITITYDVSGTSLSSLDEAWIWMWVPGAGIDAPSNINPASSNTAATDVAKFTKSTGSSGEILFQITLTPSTFLNTSASEIESIGMLLKGNDWSNGQTDDFIATISNGFTLEIDEPNGNYGFYEAAQEISISARTSETSEITISVDDVIIKSEMNTESLTANHTIIDDGAVHIIQVEANNGTESISEIYSYTISPTPTQEALPSGLSDGINYHENNTSATLVLRAPNKEHVFVIGDFNNWSLNEDYLMKKDGEVFWTVIENLTPQKEYLFQYLVDEEIKIADPYSEKVSSPFDDNEIIQDGRYPNLLPYPNGSTSEAASYLQTNQSDFEWTDFTRPDKENLVIYELLIRDFTEERTYDAVTSRLDYLADLGINAIELMPVQEFEGNLSWGYNPAFMFAIDKYYGTELDLKTLIDEAHKRGIAIILDIVLNHQFGRNSLARLYNEGLYGNPTSENPWFNVTPKHDFNVGYDMNHESQYTKDYTHRVVTYWLDEYNIDGYRFDLSKGFTQRNTLGSVSAWGNYDASRIAIWKRIADEIWSNDPNAYIILEHFADNNEEKELANYGMMLWGNMNDTYIDAAKAKPVSLGSAYHENRGWDSPHLVSYMESHDEERLMWEVTKSGWSTYEALQRAKLASAFYFTVPGPKMIWQFGEMGYDEELNNDRLGVKPTHWEYLEDADRIQLFNLYKSLANLRTKTTYIDSEFFEWSTGGWIKTINITHPDVHIYVVGNFNNESETDNHSFSKTGTWYDYFSGQSFEVGSLNEEFTLRAGQFKIYTSELIDNYIEDSPIALSSELIEESIHIFPNPTSDFIHLSGGEKMINYSITDLTGKIIQKNDNPSESFIDIRNLKNGIYHVKIDTQSGTFSRRVLKK